ncbi:restriction endonuclease [Lentzea sp. NPDC004789]
MRQLVNAIVAQIDIERAPCTIAEIIVETSIGGGWFVDRSLAEDYASRMESSAERLLRQELDAWIRKGRAARFEFNSSSSYLIQGSSYIEPIDSPEIAEAKRRRVRFSEYESLLRAATPLEFEAICRGVLVEMGAVNAKLTKASGDQGIDFYGTLSLQGRLTQVYPLSNIDRHLRVWLVGQAKHYQKTKVATPDLRELVGSVNLARAKVYADGGQSLDGLKINVCDPVFYLFFTTGEISRDGWTLIERSGIVGMDGSMLATFLADSGVAVVDGNFDSSTFGAWIALHRG